MPSERQKCEDRSKSVATAVTLLARANLDRIWAVWVNNGATDIHIGLGYDPTTTTGALVTASGGVFTINEQERWYGEVKAIATTTATVVTGFEVSRER